MPDPGVGDGVMSRRCPPGVGRDGRGAASGRAQERGGDEDDGGEPGL